MSATVAEPDDGEPRLVLMVPCRECHTPLVNPDSVARGVGPICAGKHSHRQPPKGMEPMFDLPGES